MADALSWLQQMLGAGQDVAQGSDVLGRLQRYLAPSGQTPFAPTRLSPDEESRFQQEMGSGGYGQWQDTFRQRFGEAPNLNDPQYDYRGAWRAGIVPQPYAPDQNFPHWPSATPSGQMLKSPDHPTAWMNHFMQRFGVDPNLAPPALIEQGRQQGIVPQEWAPASGLPTAETRNNG